MYFDRILRGTESDGFYSTNKLGAIGADLAAVAAFFDEPWSHVSPNLIDADRGWLLNEAALRLRALGRLAEAVHPMRDSGEIDVRAEEWKGAAISYSNLSELEVTLGRLTDAVADAHESITHADRSGDPGQGLINRTTAADALHQCGRRTEAGALFAEAERMQKWGLPKFGLLFSVRGFRLGDWLLAPAERAAWQALLRDPAFRFGSGEHGQDGPLTICDEVERRATTTLEWAADGEGPLLTIALDHLTLTRVGLVRAILANPLPHPKLDLPHVAAAINGLRNAGMMDYLPNGLLTAALYHFVRGDFASARRALGQAQQIAERGPMPLYLADIHLHRARLFRDPAELAKARGLIE